jgi:hypothetical protein
MNVCPKHMPDSHGILSLIHFNMILQSFIFLYVTSVIQRNSSKYDALPFLHPLQKTHPLSGLLDCLFNILELPSALSRQYGNVFIPNIPRLIPHPVTNVKIKVNM